MPVVASRRPRRGSFELFQGLTGTVPVWGYRICAAVIVGRGINAVRLVVKFTPADFGVAAVVLVCAYRGPAVRICFLLGLRDHSVAQSGGVSGQASRKIKLACCTYRRCIINCCNWRRNDGVTVLQLQKWQMLNGLKMQARNTYKISGMVRWRSWRVATGTGGTGHYGELRKCSPLMVIPCNSMPYICRIDALPSRTGVCVPGLS